MQCETTSHPLQQWQEATWLLIALLTPLFVNLWVEQQFEASKVWLLRTLVWILAVLWFNGWIAGIRHKPFPPLLRNLLVALGLVFLLSTALSTNRYVAIFGTLDRANGILTQLSYLLLFVCVATRITIQQSQRLLHVVVLTAVPICLLGIAQATGWQPLPVWTDARSPMIATLGRANFTGAYLALLLPLTLTAAILENKKWWRIGYTALVVLELAVVALSQARAAWLASVTGLCVLLWVQVAPRWSNRVRWCSGLSGILVVGGGLLLILRQGIASGGSIAARWTIWQASLRLLWTHVWLGYGADTLELHFPSVYPPQLVYYQGRGVVVDRVHNWLLDWSLNFGVVAVALFTTLVYFTLRNGWQHLAATEPSATAFPNETSTEQQREQRWLAACMATVCTQLVGNLFLFEVAATSVVFWLLLAIIASATACRNIEGRNIEVRSLSLPFRARKVAMVLSVCILCWAIWHGNVRPLLADIHSWSGTKALSQGNNRTALAAYTASVQRQPRRAAYHVAVALTAAQSGNFTRAYSAMDAAIALRPTDPVLYTQLAAIYARDANSSPEKVALAYRAFEQAISLAPTIALSYQQYADLALRSGDVSRALTQAQRAVSLDATDGISFGILGWSQLQNGTFSAALNAFEQAVRWKPDSADFHVGLAVAHVQQGNLDAARQAVQQSLFLDPTYQPALILRAQLQE